MCIILQPAEPAATITGKSTTYTYDAEGQKLSRLIGTAKTDYISGIQYGGAVASSTVSFIQTQEGRALPNGTSAYNYEYSLTDHLGNSRVNFDTGTGTAKKVQADDYYAFGMEINSLVNGTKNEYLYNKKELQENLGLYDYGARLYDPVVARWTSVDNKADHPNQVDKSPYAYGWNNPTNLTDPQRETAIFHSILVADEAMIKQALSLTPNLNVKDGRGWSPLHYVAQAYLVEIVDLLIDNGAELEIKDDYVNTPLWRATFASQGKGEMIKRLILRGAYPDNKNASGISPKQLARTIAITT